MADDQNAYDRAQGLSLESLTGLLGYHVRLANVAILRDFTDSLSELDLTQKQCATLRLIATNLGVSQIDLAAALDTDRSTMMAVVDRLEQRGFVERRRSMADRRRQELHLTPEGESTLARADELIAHHETRFKSRFSEQELNALIAALKRIHRS